MSTGGASARPTDEGAAGPLYRVTDLVRTFGRGGRVRALDGVSLDVQRGQRLGIVARTEYHQTQHRRYVLQEHVHLVRTIRVETAG